MALQVRKGNAEDFDAAKMKSGELAAAEDTKQLYVSFKDGTAEEVALKEYVDKELKSLVKSHKDLTDRDAADQHPISAITNLTEELNDLSPAIVATATGDTIAVPDSSERQLRGLTLYGKTFQEGTPSPTNPIPLVSVGDSSTVNVRVSGKNLIDLAMAAEATNVVKSVDEDKTINIKGELSPQWSNKPIGTALLVKGQAYIISGVLGYGRIGMSKSATSIPGSSTVPTISSNNAGNILNDKVAYCIFNALETCVAYIFYCSDNGNTGTNEAFSLQLQLETGREVTTYETPTVQTLTTQMSDRFGLPGIPVASGGNYTDENGQQWICDEINFERGVRIQRTVRYILDGTQPTKIHTDSNDRYTRFNYSSLTGKPMGAMMCDTYPKRSGVGEADSIDTIEIHGTDGYIIIRASGVYTIEEWNSKLANSPVQIIAEAAVPIETLIEPYEIAKYEELHTNKPTTVILNDEGAGVAVKYVADTKAYIDNKFAALEAAILSQGGNV